MTISRKQALKKIRGTSAAIEAHLVKLKVSTDRQLRRYWLREVGGMLREVRALVTLIGKRTELEVMARVIEWEKELAKIEDTDA